MIRLKRFFVAHRYFFFIFAFALLYAFVVVGKCKSWQASMVAYEFHALNFDVGFGSLILQGALYQWICGEPDPDTLALYLTVLMLLFFFALAWFLERLLLCVEKKDRVVAGTLIALFLTGPATFSIFITDLGIPESYWLYLSALFFFCLAYKPLNLLIAPLCVLALMMNYDAIICCVPFFCILILYKYETETSRSEKRMLLASFIVCVSVSIPVFLYLVLYTQKNMKYSLSAFNAIMQSHGVKELSYTDIVLYGREQAEYPAAFMEKMARSVLYTTGDDLTPMQQMLNLAVLRATLVQYVFLFRNPVRVVVPLLTILPVLALIFRFCFSELRNRQNPRLRRFVFFCMPALFFLTLLVSATVSHDSLKWIDFSFLPLFASFLYVLYREPQKTAAFIRRAVSMFTLPQIWMYAAVYSMCVFSAYY